MSAKRISPFGSWRSPITSDLIVAATVGLGETSIEGEDIYWIESRPWEAGRSIIVKRTTEGITSDVNPAPFNARTRVHEYGGGSYVVHRGSVYFSNFTDQQLYVVAGASAPRQLTNSEKLYFADHVMDESRGRLITVVEDHNVAGRDTINSIGSVDLKTGEVKLLVTGADFYSSPRISPDGERMAWLAWNHPNMPWDGTELWVARLNENGEVENETLVAGGVDESIFQPEWSPDGVLHFVSERTGWWNLYRSRDGRAEPLGEMEAEFGLPQWIFGMSTYSFASADRIICAFNERGTWSLASIDVAGRQLTRLAPPYTEISGVRANDRIAIFSGGSPAESSSVIKVDLATGEYEALRRSSNVQIDEDYTSVPRAVEFPTESNRKAYAFFYPPLNRDYQGPEGERPPLMVISHGGPTSAATTTLRPAIQFWTSRGFAVLDVNYGGSTGYGREYRKRLNGNWGVVDVDDCVNGARYLVELGQVDGNRLIIRGGSAGGYTTLAALTFRQFFKAGASYYGISDLEALEQDCHKFESRYNTSLIGPYPKARELYRRRSPIHHTEKLNCPLILFQGLEDKVVPANQAEMMFDAVRRKGLPVAYVAFEGEQHGFRKAENIKRALDAELYFYSRVFGFEPADEVEPVVIENLAST